MAFLAAIPAIVSAGTVAGTTATVAGTMATVASIGSTAFSVVGALKAGADAKSSLKYQSQVQAQRADEAKAAGQRRAAGQYRQGRIIQSDQQAGAAAAGGASDQSVINIMAQTAGEVDLAARTEMFNAEQQSRGFDDASAVSLVDAKRAGIGGTISAFGAGFKGASSMFDRFAATNRYKTDSKVKSNRYAVPA